MKNRIFYLLIPFTIFVLSSLLLVFGIYHGWLGEARSGVMLFCEEARAGFIKQPANSFSNLGFSIVGIIMGWHTFRNKPSNINLFSTNNLYPLSMSIILILLGAGSFALHATNTFMGGFVDLFAMFLSSSFFFCFGLRRWLNFSDSLFLLLFTLSVLICSYIWLSSWNHFGFILSVGELIVASQILFAIFIEFYMYRSRKIEANISWAIIAVVVLILAFGIWNISRTHESLWCNPNSLIQGHSIWHILNAISFYAVFKYYWSESKPAANKT